MSSLNLDWPDQRIILMQKLIVDYFTFSEKSIARNGKINGLYG